MCGMGVRITSTITSLCVAVVIWATLVNTQTDRQTYSDRFDPKHMLYK